MSPYEVKLLVHIDSCLDPIPFKRTQLLQDTLIDFCKRNLIEVAKIKVLGQGNNWETTKLGRAVCTKFYAVDDSDIKFCGECGKSTADEDACEKCIFVEVCGECGRLIE